MTSTADNFSRLNSPIGIKTQVAVSAFKMDGVSSHQEKWPSNLSRMHTPIQTRPFFMNVYERSNVKDSEISRLLKSSRVKTVEGRARNAITQRSDLFQMNEMRRKGGSRMQEGNRTSAMGNLVQQKVVSQHINKKVLSATDSDQENILKI